MPSRSAERLPARLRPHLVQAIPARRPGVTMLTDILSRCTYSPESSVGRRVVTSTVVLSGQLIIEGVKFLWWVTDGRPAR